jgi:hypothetical protein
MMFRQFQAALNGVLRNFLRRYSCFRRTASEANLLCAGSDLPRADYSAGSSSNASTTRERAWHTICVRFLTFSFFMILPI